MKPATVNLLPNKSRLQLKQLETLARVNLIVGIALAVFVVLGATIFALDFYSRTQIKKNTKELEAAKNQFISFADRINDLQELRFRTKLVAQIMQKRLLFAPGLKETEDLLGPEVILSSLNMEEGSIKAKGELATLSSFKSLEERLENENYSIMILRGLGINEDGSVGFSLEINLESKKEGEG